MWPQRKGRRVDDETPTDPPGVERKSFTIEIKDETKGEVAAVFSCFGVKDHDDDWTLPGAFAGNDEVLIGSWGHRTVRGEPPVGKGNIIETEKEAHLKGRYFLDSYEGKEQFITVKNVGRIQEWSYSYYVLETGEITEKMRQMGVRRVLKKVEVLEISPVMRGAGIRTRTLTAKDRPLDPPALTPEQEAAAKAAKEAEELAAAEKKAADDAAALVKAEADRVAAELKARTADAVEDFHRIQRTHARLGLTA